METTWKRLNAIADLDALRGLNNIFGHTENYLSLLRKYVEQYQVENLGLRAHLAAGNILLVQRQVHSLKGAAAFLGMTQIHLMANELDMALREGRTIEVIRPLAAALEAKQMKLLDSLWQALPPEPIPTQVAIQAASAG